MVSGPELWNVFKSSFLNIFLSDSTCKRFDRIEKFWLRFDRVPRKKNRLHCYCVMFSRSLKHKKNPVVWGHKSVRMGQTGLMWSVILTSVKHEYRRGIRKKKKYKKLFPWPTVNFERCLRHVVYAVEISGAFERKNNTKVWFSFDTANLKKKPLAGFEQQNKNITEGD